MGDDAEGRRRDCKYDVGITAFVGNRTKSLPLVEGDLMGCALR
jgi:hypothetical protein